MAVCAKKKKNKDEITVLGGLSGVRHRPSMYIGSCGPDGLHHLFLEIVHNAIDEHLAGTCKTIKVKLHSDNSVSVADDGRGIPVAAHSESGISQLELALTKLHAGSKFFQKKGTSFSSGLNGVGASCVNALSESMSAVVRRAGKTFYQNYREGIPQAPVRKASKAFPFKSGTLITFKPDATIFETVSFDPLLLFDVLNDLAYLNPGVTIHFEMDDTEEYESCQAVFQHKKGLHEYLKDLTEEKNVIRRDFFSMSRVGATEDMHGHRFEYKISAVVQFVREEDCVIKSFVNNVHTSDGGTHADGFISGVGRAVLAYAKKMGRIRGIKQLKQADATDAGIFSIVSFYMHEPRFASQTKKKLTNQEATKIVDNLVYEDFSKFLSANENTAKVIVSRAIENAKQRERIANIKTIIRKDTSTLAGKLAECSSKDFAQRELWLVEGDSAAGSMKMGRNTRYQAVLPLRGKIINAEKATMKAVADNNEIMSIITAIGTGVTQGKNAFFDYNKLRYNRIIIGCDADIDGSHIRTLLLAFFYRYMEPLLSNGHIYIACPPLFAIKKKDKVLKYCLNERQLQKTLNKARKRGVDTNKFDVGRYKGLGEMNPDQLWHTTMNPNTRKLVRMTIKDGKDVDAMLEVLMGSDTEARRNFIEANATEANLDI